MNTRPIIAYRLARYYIRCGMNFTRAVKQAWRHAL